MAASDVAAQRAGGSTTVFHHVGELEGVVAMRINAGIGAVGDLHAGLHALREIVALKLTKRLLLRDRFRRNVQLLGA